MATTTRVHDGNLNPRGRALPLLQIRFVTRVSFLNAGVVPPTEAEREEIQRRRRMGHTEADDEAAADVAQQFSELLS